MPTLYKRGFIPPAPPLPGTTGAHRKIPYRYYKEAATAVSNITSDNNINNNNNDNKNNQQQDYYYYQNGGGHKDPHQILEQVLSKAASAPPEERPFTYTPHIDELKAASRKWKRFSDDDYSSQNNPTPEPETPRNRISILRQTPLHDELAGQITPPTYGPSSHLAKSVYHDPTQPIAAPTNGFNNVPPSPSYSNYDSLGRPTPPHYENPCPQNSPKHFIESDHNIHEEDPYCPAYQQQPEPSYLVRRISTPVVNYTITENGRVIKELTPPPGQRLDVNQIQESYFTQKYQNPRVSNQNNNTNDSISSYNYNTNADNRNNFNYSRSDNIVESTNRSDNNIIDLAGQNSHHHVRQAPLFDEGNMNRTSQPFKPYQPKVAADIAYDYYNEDVPQPTKVSAASKLTPVEYEDQEFDSGSRTYGVSQQLQQNKQPNREIFFRGSDQPIRSSKSDMNESSGSLRSNYGGGTYERNSPLTVMENQSGRNGLSTFDNRNEHSVPIKVTHTSIPYYVERFPPPGSQGHDVPYNNPASQEYINQNSASIGRSSRREGGEYEIAPKSYKRGPVKDSAKSRELVAELVPNARGDMTWHVTKQSLDLNEPSRIDYNWNLPPSCEEPSYPSYPDAQYDNNDKPYEIKIKKEIYINAKPYSYFKGMTPSQIMEMEGISKF